MKRTPRSSFAMIADLRQGPQVNKVFGSANTQCGPVGERLVVQVADEIARRAPSTIWATITKSPYDIAEGFQDITFQELANAVNHAAWWMESIFGKSSTFDTIAYIGVSDVRYAIFMFASIKIGHQVSSFRAALRKGGLKVDAVFTQDK